MDARHSIVLLIEDGVGDDSSTRDLVQELGATCHRVTSVEDAESVLEHSAPDVVIVDYDLPDGSDRLISPASGIKSVIVNGKLLIEDNETMPDARSALPGKLLRNGLAA